MRHGVVGVCREIGTKVNTGPDPSPPNLSNTIPDRPIEICKDTPTCRNTALVELGTIGDSCFHVNPGKAKNGGTDSNTEHNKVPLKDSTALPKGSPIHVKNESSEVDEFSHLENELH